MLYCWPRGQAHFDNSFSKQAAVAALGLSTTCIAGTPPAWGTTHMEKKIKVANETQRREARKLLEAAARDKHAAIRERYKKKDPTESEILDVLRSGKIKLMPLDGRRCSCITIYTSIGHVIDFGQSRNNKERDDAEKKMDEAKRAAIGRVSLATMTAEELLKTVDEFRAAKF